MITRTIDRAWLVLGTLLTVVALPVATLSVISLVAHDEVERTWTFPAAGLSGIEVDTANGTIELVAADVDQVTVDARISHGLRNTDYRAEVVDDLLEVASGCPLLSSWCEVDYHIQVPKDLPIDISSSNGRLTVRGSDAPVRARGSNSRVELVDLSGDVYATTDNGSIEASGLRSSVVVTDTSNGRTRIALLEPPREVRASTDNGSVDIALPRTDDTYRVDLETDNGSTDSMVATDPTSERIITARSSNGSLTVGYLAD